MPSVRSSDRGLFAWKGGMICPRAKRALCASLPRPCCTASAGCASRSSPGEAWPSTAGGAANTIVLQFTAPIFVLLISLVLFHRRPDKLDLITCAAVFGGILFFFLDSLEMGGGLGNVLALLSGLAYAGVFLLNDMPNSDAISSVFWGDVLSAVTGLPFLVKETDFSPTAITSLVVLGVFQVAVAYILLTIGLKTTPPVTASLVSGIEPVLNPILVAVFYKETMGPMALIGAAVVIGSVVLYNVCRAKQPKSEILHTN